MGERDAKGESHYDRIRAYYRENVVGFGWTNAVVLRLLRGVER